MPDTLLVILSPLVVLLLVNVILPAFRSRKTPLPPGPKPLPLVGNLFDITGDLMVDCDRYRKWCKELRNCFDTDVLQVNVLGRSIVFLNTYEASTDILEKRSNVHSGRWYMPMMSELMGWGFHVAFLTYGDEWRKQRKLMHQQLNATAMKGFRSYQLKATRRLLVRLLLGPEDVVREFKQLAGEVILSVTYGIDLKSSDDPYMRMAEDAIHPIHEATIPGAFLVDTFPCLKYIPSWFPGAGFKRKAREWQKLVHIMINVPFSATKEDMANGYTNPCFVSNCLESVDPDNIHSIENDVKSAAGAMYQGGSETTVAGLASCILALLMHPSALKRAQQEIDSVVSPESLPDFCDQDSLPYTTAVIKEALRWKPVAPVAVPHTSCSEDIYKGYHIPSGSLLIPNSLGILHDNTVFPKPELFIPERFMKNNGVAEDRFQVTWGYGRRICPGRFLAFDTLWIAIASIISVYDISKPVDENGNIIEVNPEYTTTILPLPGPFKVVFKPRNEAAEVLIKSL